VKDVLDAAYVERASSPEAAAVRAVSLPGREARRRAAAVLEAHFGKSRWDRRMRLRLADVLLKAGKDQDALPILIGLADEMATSGASAKAVAIIKKIEQIQKQSVEVVNLAPLLRPQEEPDLPPVAEAAAAARPVTDDRLHGWLVELLRGTLRGAPPPPSSLPPAVVGAARAYGRGLLANPLFEGFTEEELLAFIQGLRLLTFVPGDVIVSEGEPGESVFILTTGRVKVFVRDPDGANVSVATLGEGTFFGEISTLSGRPRSATVTAAAGCEILELDRAGVDGIAAVHPRVRAVLEAYSAFRERDPEARRARGPRPR
jgi:hypothetical protein